MKPNLGLGSAQFGMEYGISNHAHSTVTHAELGRILSLAALSGIRVIDTAHLYGSSLQALGRYHKLIENRSFRIITKVPPIRGYIDFDAIINLRSIFLNDLKQLRVGWVDTLMIHDAQDLLRPGSDLVYDFLLNMKLLGFCRRIGVSVYHPSEILSITKRYHLDVCQFPTNIFDQRFNLEVLKELKNRGLELHARSIFLQGLLLMDYDDIPRNLKRHVDYTKFRKLRGLMENPLATSLNWLWQNDLIDHGIVGVGSSTQLMEILTAYRKTLVSIDFQAFASTNQKLINPSLWNI